jgi:hypothetical protein
MVPPADKPAQVAAGSAEHAKAVAENERLFAEKTGLAKRELGAEIVNWKNSEELGPDIDLPSASYRYTDDELRAIIDYDAYLDHLGATAIAAEDYIGSGATILLGDDKMRLVGEPFVILQYNFTRGDYGGYYVYVECLTKNGTRYAFTSGAQFSIRDELASIAVRHGIFNGIVCRKGLKLRTYDYPKNPAPGEKPTEVKVYSIAPAGKSD